MSEHTRDMLDDEAEEKRARWIFNLVVFFLLFPFAIDLTYMTGSLIPVGAGVSLMVWRVWRTPGITNPIYSHMQNRLRRFVRNLAIALGVAPILLGVSVQVASNPYSASRGFPFSVTYVIPGCFGPGSPLGCVAYDPLEVVLDYLFWVGLSIAILTLAGWLHTRLPRDKLQEIALDPSHLYSEIPETDSAIHAGRLRGSR